MKKQLLTLCVALIATINLFASNTQVNGIWYDFDDTNLTASVTYRGSSYYSYYDEYTGSVVIPASVNYNYKTYSITTIGGVAFKGCSGLTSVTIPNSVTTIEGGAFSDCSSLTSIAIPNSVITIEGATFSGCKKLTSVTIPNSVTTIGIEAFYECINLTSITIPDSVTTIGKGAFSSCGLTSVTIPNSVTTIGKGAFSGCKKLTTVTINSNELCGKDYTSSSSFETIFGSQVTQYILGSSVTTIGNCAFYGCSSLTSVTIPNSVITIGRSAFEYCEKLTSVTIPNSVTTIGNSAFRGCSSLTSVTIPNSVITIGDYAFEYCFSLTSPVYNANCFAYMPQSYQGTYIVPDGIQQIVGCAFYDCSGLTSITIPNSVTTIGNRAFEGCSSLTKTNCTNITDWCNIQFDDSLANPISYSHNLYLNDVEVKDLIIPNGVNTIGDYLFYGCHSLTSVTIPNSAKAIGEYAFYGCTNLNSAIIGNSVTTIGDYAFRYCSSLTSITIPNSVTTIGRYAFRGCYGLTSVTIGNSIKTIGDWAFLECDSLKKTNYTGTIADWCKIKFAVRSWSSNPMEYSHNFYINDVEIKDLIIPNGVDSIKYYAFYGCSSLTSVTIPYSVETIQEEAFWGCKGLKSVTIRSDEICRKDYTTIYNMNHIFGTQVEEFIIGDSVTTIGKDAFYTDVLNYKYNYLTSVTFGKSVKKIGDYAFSGCASITSMTSYANVPPACGTKCFGIVDRSIPVYVPAQSLDAYKQADTWKEFWNIQPIEDTGIEELFINSSHSPVTKLMKGGQLLILHNGKMYNALGDRMR